MRLCRRRRLRSKKRGARDERRTGGTKGAGGAAQVGGGAEGSAMMIGTAIGREMESGSGWIRWLPDAAVRAESGRRTRRSFLVAAAAAAGGYGFYRWIDRSPGDQLIPRPLRKMLDFNAKVARGVFDERGLAPTYPVQKSMELRTNGNYGLKMDLVPESYRLQMVGVENAKRFPQYVDDVTAWEYKYAAKKEPGPVEHDTKVAPKDEAKVDPNSDAGAGEGPMMQGGPASTMVGGAARRKRRRRCRQRLRRRSRR